MPHSGGVTRLLGALGRNSRNIEVCLTKVKKTGWEGALHCISAPPPPERVHGAAPGGILGLKVKC